MREKEKILMTVTEKVRERNFKNKREKGVIGNLE